MKKNLCVLMVLVFFTIPAFAASSSELIVGVDYATVQEAVDAASDGDTIVILEGEYTSPAIIITKSINVIGQGDVRLNITSAGWGSMFHVLPSGVERLENVVIKNLTIEPDGVTTGYGLKVEGTDGLEIKNVNVRAAYRSAVDIHGCSDVNIKNLIASDAAYGVGLAFTNTSDVVVKNVKTNNNAWAGIAIFANEGAYDYEGGSRNYEMINLKSNEDVVLYIQSTAGTVSDIEVDKKLTKTVVVPENVFVYYTK